MSRLSVLLESCSQPVTKEQLEKIIYSIFCLIIFTTPVIPELIGFGIYSLKETIFNISTIFIAISLLIINMKDIKKLKIDRYSILLIAYLFLVILSTIFTKFGLMECILGENGRGEGLLTIFSYVITFVIFSKGYKQMKEVSTLAIVAAIIVAIYSIIQAKLPEGVIVPIVPKSLPGIAMGTMKNQNFLSSYICMFLPMCCYYFINGTDKLKRCLIVCTLLFLALVYSVTLGGYITFGFIGGIIIIFSIVFSANKKHTILRIGILSITLLVAFIVTNYEKKEQYVKEVSQVKQEVVNLVNKKEEFATGRLEIWKKCFMVISNNILLGTGPDSLARELNDSKYITNGTQDVLEHYIIDKAHSEPLHIAATTGVPSSLVYVILVGTVGITLLILCFKTVKKYGIKSEQSIYITMVLICFASYLVQSVANISVIQVAPMYWAVLGTSAGITLNNKISTL